ncbi:MAG: hypothetical protein U0791_23695 [Gemmataceae bacterium]
MARINSSELPSANRSLGGCEQNAREAMSANEIIVRPPSVDFDSGQLESEDADAWGETLSQGVH